jgi:hypothetical protein
MSSSEQVQPVAGGVAELCPDTRFCEPTDNRFQVLQALPDNPTHGKKSANKGEILQIRAIYHRLALLTSTTFGPPF